MPPVDDPLCRLKGRAVFEEVLRDFWMSMVPPVMLKWPRFDHHYLDTYFMYEVLQALGGIKHVTEARKFSVVKRLLHISEGYTAFSTAGRQHYERWVSPCEHVLKNAVENEYRRNGHWVATYDWLHYVSEESVESSDVDRYNRSGEAGKAAIRARYAVHILEECENAGTLPTGLSPSCPATVRLDLRNHVLRMWHRYPHRRLDIYTAVRDVPAKYHGLACAIYTQLVVAGAINFGAVPFTTPVAVKFARDPARTRPRVAVIGAGFAGLTAARQLRMFGIGVSVLEARTRLGGRVHSTSEGGFSCDVDLGAMLITGIVQNPIALLAKQTEAQLHILDNGCSLFDVTGAAVPKDIDAWAEREYNATLDVTASYRRLRHQSVRTHSTSLGEAFLSALHHRERKRCNNSTTSQAPDSPAARRLQSKLHGSFNTPTVGASNPSQTSADATASPNTSSLDSKGPDSSDRTDTDVSMLDVGNTSSSTSLLKAYADLPGMEAIAVKSASEDESIISSHLPKDQDLVQRLLWWHLANLEYACAGELTGVSLLHWDQDDPFGFIGDHALIQNGFKTLVNALSAGLERNISKNCEVLGIKYSAEGDSSEGVEVRMRRNGEVVTERFDAAVVTVPLGVLKAGSIQFEPELPGYKKSAIERLGCGALMKVILEFPEQFWIKKDMFGNLRESEDTRGEFYIFWNMEPCCGKPILIGMVTEPAASRLERMETEEIVARAMTVLRRRYPHAPYPVASAVSRWGLDPYARGVYTSISTASSGLDYDLLARPTGNVFFAGEHTCRQYPTTCASAVISGLRESRNVVEHFQLVESINAVHARALADALQLGEAEDNRHLHQGQWGNIGRKLQ